MHQAGPTVTHEQSTGGFWDRVSRGVMAHPVVAVVLAAGLLILAAIPYFDINLGQSGVSSMPDSFTSKQGFEALQADFGGGPVALVEIVVDGDANSPEVLAAVDDLEAAAASEPVLNAASYETNAAGDLGVLSFQLGTDPFAGEAVDAVERLRGGAHPSRIRRRRRGGLRHRRCGDAAINVDQINLTEEYTPFLFAFVLGLSFLLLMVVFRSIVVPAKAIVMNLLSVGAAYGLLVLVFQKGVSFGVFRRSTRSRPGCRCSYSPSSSACLWVTTSSCSAASVSVLTRPATTPSRWRSACGQPAA